VAEQLDDSGRSSQKECGGEDIYRMLFVEWLAHRHVETLLRLLEGADYFNPQSYNSAFVAGLDDLLGRIHDPAAREQIEALRDFDFGSYIARSLARAGFTGENLQEHFHALVVRLLLKPGKLFRGWNPEVHGPLDRRMKSSTWNGIRNFAEKQRNRRKWSTNTDPGVMAGMFAGKQDHSSSLVDQFTRLVADRLGPLAAAILDWRFDGNEVKDMVGNPQFGSPSVYAIKREVQEIKRLAHEFAIQNDDPGFLAAVERGMNAEARTVQKRQQSMAARQVGRNESPVESAFLGYL
jgi:hypothetical protein